MIRIGLLGASKIAPKAMIGPAQAREDCTVVAVASRSESRARRYANAHGIPEIETSYESLVARGDIDLIRYQKYLWGFRCPYTQYSDPHGT